MAAGQPSIDNTIGSAYIGWGLSSFVFGVLCIQVWSYYQRYPRDNTAYKSLVGGLWLLELLHQVMVGHCVYSYTVTNFGNVLVLAEKPIWTLSWQVFIGALVGTIVKICFGMRVWKFSKGNYLITGTIMILAVAQLGTALTYTLKSVKLRLIQANQLKTLGTASLALGVATDIVTAAALSYFLHKMRTGYAKSDTLINRLILYSVNNGILTSACSLTVVILYNVMPTNFIFMGLYFVLSKLYANSCLATLNTRRFVHGKGTDREEGTGPTFLMVGNLQGRSQNRHIDDMQKSRNAVGVNSHSPVEVDVHHEVSVTSDPIPKYAQAW